MYHLSFMLRQQQQNQIKTKLNEYLRELSGQRLR